MYRVEFRRLTGVHISKVHDWKEKPIKKLREIKDSNDKKEKERRQLALRAGKVG